ncbi:MAG: hypothetical protein ACREMO_07405 [Gemmatimonadales bacterium]
MPRDSAWARARRGFAAEVLTLDVVDSVHGTLTGRRYPRGSAVEGSLETCEVMVHLNLAPASEGTSLAWDTRWVAPKPLAAAKPAFCDNERLAVLSRIEKTIVP